MHISYNIKKVRIFKLNVKIKNIIKKIKKFDYIKAYKSL